MIVSELEIHNVIDLLVRPAPQPAFPRFCDVRFRSLPTAFGQPGGIGGGDGRRGRLECLRSLLSLGQYDVAPSMVAEKMVGRAICDQVARRYDS